MEQPTKRVRTAYDLKIEDGLKRYYEAVKAYTLKKGPEKFDAMIKKEIESSIDYMRKNISQEWFKMLNHFHIPSHDAFPDMNDPRYKQMPYTLDDSRYTSIELLRELVTTLYDAPEHKQESYYLLSLRFGKPEERARVAQLLREQPFSNAPCECPFYGFFRLGLIYTDTQYDRESF